MNARLAAVAVAVALLSACTPARDERPTPQPRPTSVSASPTPTTRPSDPAGELQALLEHTGAPEVLQVNYQNHGVSIQLLDRRTFTMRDDGTFHVHDPKPRDPDDDLALEFEPFNPRDARFDVDEALKKLQALDPDEDLMDSGLRVWRHPGSGMTTVTADLSDYHLQAPSLEPLPKIGMQVEGDALMREFQKLRDLCPDPVSAYVSDDSMGCDNGLYVYWGDDKTPLSRIRASHHADGDRPKRLKEDSFIWWRVRPAYEFAKAKYTDAHVTVSVEGFAPDTLDVVAREGEERHSATCTTKGEDCRWES